MTTTLRRFLAASAVLTVAAAGALLTGVLIDDNASARDQASRFTTAPSGDGAGQSSDEQTMEQFLTAVTQDTDRYWTKIFEQSGIEEPRVNYAWIPAGQTVQSACGSDAMGDGAAAYCPGDDTIYISEKFATDIYTGALDHALPGSSQGFGRTYGDFAVAYIVAHEYGHQIQDELGLFERGLPTSALELQADCYAGAWANSAYEENRLDDGDVQEALDAALAVGDFDPSNPGHHGTPEQRREAWAAGFESGDPAACSSYVAA
jgi:uncharacterized protein